MAGAKVDPADRMEGPQVTDETGQATDAIAFIKALGIAKADILGYSIGGKVAQEIAVQAPDLVRKLVPAAGGAGLAAAGSTATQKLALAAGKKLTPPSATSGGSSGSSGSHGGSSLVTWIVLGVGLALIVLAAAISLRFRPMRRKSKSGSPPRG